MYNTSVNVLTNVDSELYVVSFVYLSKYTFSVLVLQNDTTVFIYHYLKVEW